MDAKPGRRGSITRKVAIGVIAVLVLGGVGALVSALREATASPKDKEACLATVEMIETDGRTIENAMTKWSLADDDSIRGQIDNVQTAMASRDAAKLADAVNQVIARCNKISSGFRSRFDEYCDTHEGACRRNFGL